MCILFVAISLGIRYYYEMEGALAVTDENKAEKEGATAAAVAAAAAAVQRMIVSPAVLCTKAHSTQSISHPLT